MGAGFGTDLTAPLESQFGVQTDDRGRPVRSPHNILVTLFARTGVVGLGLWLAFQGTWFARIFHALRHARAVGLDDEADLLLWLAGYVLLVLVSATLGVVLEGPYGAIPYFLLVGMSLRYATDLMAVAESAPQQIARSAPVARLSGVSALRA